MLRLSLIHIWIGTEGLDAIKTLEGQIPSPINPPSGCPFHTRCAKATARCAETVPAETYLNERHYVRCLLFEEAPANAN